LAHCRLSRRFSPSGRRDSFLSFPCRQRRTRARAKPRSPGASMNVIDAAYSTVHDYPGGAEALAARMGKSAAVLRSKVNPNTSTHHLTLAEADEILGKTRDLRMLHALAANHGCVVLPADD